MQEAGLIDRLSVKWWGFKLEADKAELERGLETLTLGYENVLFPFGILGAGILIAIAANIGELCGGDLVKKKAPR